jgi:ribosomal protein L11 methylase PrmA
VSSDESGPVRFTPSETSFRDPQSGVVIAGTDVYRFFRGPARVDFESLRDAGLFAELAQRGMVREFLEPNGATVSDLGFVFPSDSLVVQQRALPFVSYPYEWPFGMLRAAALLQLELLELTLSRGATLKDASPYNVQFIGTDAYFIDLGSFERYTEGRPWGAYTQFCNLFLHPLILDSFVGVPFQPWMRSSLEGVPAGLLSRTLPLRAKLRPDIFTNVVLQGFLNGRVGFATPDELGVKPVIPKRAVLRHIRKLRDLVSSLKPPRRATQWSSYAEANSYSPAAREQKAAFVESAVIRARPQVVWDLGSNSGDYAVLASKHAPTVIAMDSDPALVDTVYSRARSSRAGVLPLVMDLTNPSPDQGWDQRERGGLAARGPADLVLALALVHHVRLRGNVPVSHIVRWLERIAKRCVVEFVPKTDPAARRLLAWRDDVYEDYDEKQFEAALSERFIVDEKSRIADSERVLYSAHIR